MHAIKCWEMNTVIVVAVLVSSSLAELEDSSENRTYLTYSNNMSYLALTRFIMHNRRGSVSGM